MPRKRGDAWYTDFYFDGRRYRRRIPGARVRHEAVQAETKIRNDLFQKAYGPTILKDKPLAKFAQEDFLPWAENNKKQPRHDRCTTRIWLELPSLKGKTVREVSQFDIESAKVARRRSVSRYGRPVEPQTVNRELIIMSSLFHRAVEWHYRVDNPCKGVKMFDVAAGPPRYLSADEEERLMPEVWAGPPYLPRLVLLAIGTGMRQIEMRHLKKADVDLARETLYVRDPKWKNDPRSTKGLPLSPEVCAVLAELMGHSKIEMTRIYVHPSLETKRQAVRKALVTTWSQRGGHKAEEEAGKVLKMVG
jgi:integrase